MYTISMDSGIMNVKLPIGAKIGDLIGVDCCGRLVIMSTEFNSIINNNIYNRIDQLVWLKLQVKGLFKKKSLNMYDKLIEEEYKKLRNDTPNPIVGVALTTNLIQVGGNYYV